jgi:hypothetical protein
MTRLLPAGVEIEKRIGRVLDGARCPDVPEAREGDLR